MRARSQGRGRSVDRGTRGPGIEPRNTQPVASATAGSGCRGCQSKSKATPWPPHWRGGHGPRAVRDPVHARKHLAREPGDPAFICGPLGSVCCRAHREAARHTTMSHGRGKSDCCVVPKKPPNKAAGATPAAAAGVEGRRQAKGDALAARMSRRSVRPYDMGRALEGIRQTARGRRDARFPGLLHHIYEVERLRAAYYALKRDAAAGVDGQTWQSYGQALEANLLDLSDRLARGGYRPEPVRRVYIDKADGSKRAVGVPAPADQLVHI